MYPPLTHIHTFVRHCRLPCLNYTHAFHAADDNCYGSVYGVHVNGKPRSPSYHVYDVRGSTYTVLKLSGFGLTLQQAEVRQRRPGSLGGGESCHVGASWGGG